MTRIMRPAVAASAALLLGLSLSACGGPPTDASVEDYCDAVNDDSAFDDLDADSDEEDFVKALQEFADNLEEVGTPEDIPDDAREGFEISLETVDDLEADDLDLEDPNSSIEDKLSDDEKDKVDAYEEYESETCSESSGEE